MKLSVGSNANFKLYVGIKSEPVSLTNLNISSYFTVSNSSYYFVGSGSTWSANNLGVGSSTATTTWTAKKNLTIGYTLTYVTESNYDKVTITGNGNTLVNAASGSSNYTGSVYLPSGSSIVFAYTKDGSVDASGESVVISDVTITLGSSGSGSIAKKIVNGWVGVSNKARKISGCFVGYGNVAKACYTSNKQAIAKLSESYGKKEITVGVSYDGNYAYIKNPRHSSYYTGGEHYLNKSYTLGNITNGIDIEITSYYVPGFSSNVNGIFYGIPKTGYCAGYINSSNTVTFNTTTPSNATTLRNNFTYNDVKFYSGGGKAGNYAVFGTGSIYYGTTNNYAWHGLPYIDTYNSSMTLSSKSVSSSYRGEVGGGGDI